MKNYKNIVYAAMSMLLWSTSCNDWLDVQPKTELKESELFSTEQGFKEALTGVYVSMTNGTTYGRELTFGMLSVMASDYSVNSSSEQAVLSLKAIEEYDYTKNQVKGIIDQVWLNQYNSIALTNNILGSIEAKRSVFSDQGYNLVKGEALALRAFVHFDLMRMFAPAYITKDNAKYMPYVTRYTRENTPLSTVDELVEYILNDIKEAEMLLKDDVVNKLGTADRKIRMNRLAVKGLKARVLLYIGNHAGAYQAAKEVIDARQVVLRPESQEINLDRSIHSEHLFSLFSDGFEERVTKLVTPESGTLASVPYYFTDEDKLRTRIFENVATDIRFKVPVFQMYRGLLTPHKFMYVDIPVGTPNVNRQYIPLMRLGEMYLIAAEAAPTKDEGVALLNALCTNRGMLAFANDIDLVEKIKQEYRKEFFSEGQTFYYYKRLGAKKVDDSPVNDMSNAQYVFPMPENEKIYGGRN
ncbi:RagB/SusD family nutrient uptake outer membrane protein [Sphingobacterium psychroaquaticum]|uniref:RagB/SusD family nutrient uptake outer membrane protein n=1 Tax=Sphingobacterium psychroaquaticum TaxID=561061 RepID=UPI00106A6F5B|nr:RagB/SusD family nutrient uptake outer membrane protein [Sphingobacterium psychroaquaticum]QBQ41343.1 RagB/SusD family nutrient uptake outer membrane protein [Sphingobacterium psychroaquaticum]